MRRIEVLREVEALIGMTYVYAIIVAVAAVGLAYIVARVIKFGGGKRDTSHIKRRVWYIAIGILAAVSFFLYNSLYVSKFIMKAPLLAKFSTANILATLVILGVYAALGISTMLMLRTSKWGSILGKSKK